MPRLLELFEEQGIATLASLLFTFAIVYKISAFTMAQEVEQENLQDRER